ncbi:MAG TPA: Rieske (2Fe-2S) protein [Micromonosporaceae bacterium]|nr:Rieske (2Fe-2S) protein [Micromonosporaceae bacterium]
MGDARTTAGGASRRGVLLGAGAVGASVVLAGCGGDSGNGGDTDAGGATTGPAATTAPAASSSTAGGASGGFAKTSDIPVGGGKVFAAERVVVTQPAAGTFKGFTTTCTHMACQVESVSGGTINCPCHGSMFSIADGSVKNGPAARPLPAKEIKVEGDEILMA